MLENVTYNIPFRPQSIHGVYGTNYYFHKKDGQQRLQFEATIKYCGQYMDEYSIYHISKQEYMVNRNESDAYLYDIAKKCTEVIYPITILVDPTGALASVRTDNIGKKWAEKKAELVKYYKGEVADRYIEKVDRLLKNPQKLALLVTSDLFFSQLFACKYQTSENIYEFEREIRLIPLIRPLEFSSTQSFDTDNINDTECNTIKISHKGMTQKEYKYGDFYKSPKMNISQYNAALSSEYQLNYKLEKSQLNIESITGCFTTKVAKEEFLKIEMKAYRLYERQLEFGFDEELAKLEKEQQGKNDSSLFKAIKFILSI